MRTNTRISPYIATIELTQELARTLRQSFLEKDFILHLQSILEKTLKA